MKKKNFLLMMGFLAYSQSISADAASSDDQDTNFTNPSQITSKGRERKVDRGFIFGEFLYLQPIVDGLEYGFIQNNSINPTPLKSTVKAKTKDLDFDWSPGFRIGAGYLSPTNWDLSVEWTHLISNADDSYHSSGFPQSFLNTQWLSDTVGGMADQACARWHLNFNTVDLLIGKDFTIGKRFSLRPFMGVRTAWIHQNYRINYHSQFQFSPVNVPNNPFSGGFLPFDSKIRMKQEFTAGGLRLGSDFNWNFVSDWSLWGSFSASLLYGHYDYKLYVLGANLTQFPDSSIRLVPLEGTLTDKYNRVRASFQEDIGVQWARWFGKYQLLVRVGYELSQWIDQNDFINVLSTTDTQPVGNLVIENISSNSLVRQGKNLMFQGITARVEFTF